ncbi:hypothetical protein Bca101_088260 [Brassica carinata]
MSSSSSVITPEDVLESLMNDGTIDALRLKIINQLKANGLEELKSTTIKMAEESKVLNTPGAEKQTKRELFDALRQELDSLELCRGPVLEKASKSVWELILEKDGLGKEINETVERVFCRLSGREPPLFSSSSNVENQMVREKETETKEDNCSNTEAKKRSLSEVNHSEVAIRKKKQQGDSSIDHVTP